MTQCLIIDDSRVIRKIMRRIVEELHLDANEAEDGAAALEQCRANMPEIILLDWSLPGSTAPEFLRALRREPGGAKPFVVFCPIDNDAAHVTEAVNAGANDYIMKPFDREVIETKFADAGLI